MSTLVASALIVLIGGGCVALTRRIERANPAPVTAPPPRSATAGRPPENVVERLSLALKGRRGARAALSVLSVGLLIGAAGMVGYPFYTNLYQGRLQSQLDRQLASPDLRQAYVNRQVAEGDSLTRIQIPDIGIDTVVGSVTQMRSTS